jgi:hypothetical protein
MGNAKKTAKKQTAKKKKQKKRTHAKWAKPTISQGMNIPQKKSLLGQPSNHRRVCGAGFAPTRLEYRSSRRPWGGLAGQPPRAQKKLGPSLASAIKAGLYLFFS